MVAESHQLFSCRHDLEHHRRRCPRCLGLRRSSQRKPVCVSRNAGRRFGANHNHGVERGTRPRSAIKASNQTILGYNVVCRLGSCAVGARLGISIQHPNHAASCLDAHNRCLCRARALDRQHHYRRLLVGPFPPRVGWPGSPCFTNVHFFAYCGDLGRAAHVAGSWWRGSHCPVHKQPRLDPANRVALAPNEMNPITGAA